MKTLAYIPVHYGLEYLEYTIKSIEPFVDRILIIYTCSPSYGQSDNSQCPESENDLMSLAMDTSSKIMWHRINCGDGTEHINREGKMRSLPFRWVNDHDVIITLDTDEVWKPDEVEKAIKDTYDGDHTHYGINGFVNFWRSFGYVVKDGFQPVRTHNLKGKIQGQGTINSTIYHFGYAQNAEIMRYKMSCHGHKSEMNARYLDNKYFRWTGIGCGVIRLHPASNDIWIDAEPFDKRQLPDLLKAHPNYEKLII